MHLYKYGNKSCLLSLVTAPRPAPLSCSLQLQFPLCHGSCPSPPQPSPPALLRLWLSLQQPPLLHRSVALYSATGWLCRTAASAAARCRRAHRRYASRGPDWPAEVVGRCQPWARLGWGDAAGTGPHGATCSGSRGLRQGRVLP